MSFGIPVRNGVMLGLTASTALTTRGGFPVPALSLNFLSGTLDSRITFTRALNTATRTNSSGLIETVNANIPRFDYDPVTLQPRGLLVEEARTNLALYSEQFDNPAWSKLNATVTANATSSPDGTVNADKLAEDATAAVGHLISQGPTLTAVAHTYSVYAKASERNWICLLNNSVANVLAFFNLTTGTIGTVGSATTATITNAGNGWYRCSITFTAIAAPNNCHIRLAPSDNVLSYNGVAGNGAFIYGAQIEAGAFATSYIPTVASTVTRNADTATMTGTNFSSWYNASEGAFISWFDTLSPTAQRYIYSANAGGAIGNSFFQTILSNTTDSYIFSGGVQQARLLTGTINADVPAKLGLRYANANFAVAANGGGLQTQLSGSLPVGIDRLHIGRSAGNAAFLNGHITKLFWYTSLTNAELVALTK